jgi:phosphoglycerol transferase MdoB-like AlkP superfamily enzyme
LSGLGFTSIYGEELFLDRKKYTFDAAPDQDLYTTTLQTITKQNKPYFMVLQTISFHKPYDTPYGDTEAKAIRYTDKSLYYFYQKLKQN